MPSAAASRRKNTAISPIGLLPELYTYVLAPNYIAATPDGLKQGTQGNGFATSTVGSAALARVFSCVGVARR